MPNKTIADEISIIAKYEINRIPQSIRCTIVKVYDDGIHADVQTTDGSTIKYLETISNNLAVDNLGVLIFLNGDENDYIVITK